MSGIIAQNVGRHTGLVKAAGGGGAWNLIQTIDSDGSDATMDFTSGLDSTYDEYVFLFNSLHPEHDGRAFEFHASTDGGSSYGVATTSHVFQSEHTEDDSGAQVRYRTNVDAAQSTDPINLANSQGGAADEAGSGYLHLYAPSSTTFVKHFFAQFPGIGDTAGAWCNYTGGYINTTDAVNAIQFGFTIDNTSQTQAGSISMYGVS